MNRPEIKRRGLKRKTGKLIDEKEPHIIKKKVGFFKKIWRFVDGKKLYIGLAVAGAGLLVIPGPTGLLLQYVGGAIGGVGALHGAKKINEALERGGKIGTWETFIMLIIQLIKEWLEKKKGGR